MTSQFSALDLSPNAYAVFRPDGVIAWANAAMVARAGMPLERIVGLHHLDIFLGPDGVQNLEAGAIIDRSIQAVVRTGKPDQAPMFWHTFPARADGPPIAYFTAIHTPVFGADGEVAYVLQCCAEITELAHLDGAVAGPADLASKLPGMAADLMMGARAAHEQHRMLDQERRRYEQMFKQAPGLCALVMGPDHAFEFVNDAYRHLVGERLLVGCPAAEALPELVEQGFILLLNQVYATGEPFTASAAKVLLKAETAERRTVYLDFIFQPVTDDRGEVYGVFFQGQDVTTRKLAEEQLGRVIKELRHRVKNTLAGVMAIAARTSRTCHSVESFLPAFESRLIALSTTHDLLTSTNWASADLRQIIEQELRPYDSGRVRLDGSRTDLPPQAALPLGLAVHELATNAAKYGSLSQPEGTVDIRWWTEWRNDASTLILDWCEAGGPPVKPPLRRGFGTDLLDGMMRRGSEPVLYFDQQGLRCHLVVPLGPGAPSGREDHGIEQ